MFAPRSGKETRQKIQEGVSDMKHQASDKIDRLNSKIRKTGRKAKTEMQELNSKTARRSKQQSPVLTAWEEEV
jgi:gas vesicle protein